MTNWHECAPRSGVPVVDVCRVASGVKVLVIGAAGRIGSRIAAELTLRGHTVTPLARRQGTEINGIPAVVGDVTDAASVTTLCSGQDAIISALGVPADGEDRGDQFVRSGLAVISGARAAGIGRVLIVGGGGSLQVTPGRQWVDTENFLPGNPRQPADALAHRELLRRLRLVQDVNWTYLSPPMQIAPGERTGHYRQGADSMLFDNAGISQISMEDYAVAMVDELETAAHQRQRFTVAY